MQLRKPDDWTRGLPTSYALNGPPFRDFHHVRDRNLRRPRDDPPHYRFHWMGTHLKQEIVSFGGCQAIPQTWSVEG
jgi:hypothetical protein